MYCWENNCYPLESLQVNWVLLYHTVFIQNILITVVSNVALFSLCCQVIQVKHHVSIMENITWQVQGLWLSVLSTNGQTLTLIEWVNLMLNLQSNCCCQLRQFQQQQFRGRHVLVGQVCASDTDMDELFDTD